VPIQRCGLLRNVAVALGNCGALRPCRPRAPLNHEEALVRGTRVWALGRIGTEDTCVREEIAAALTPI
jgi:hypothetical protein